MTNLPEQARALFNGENFATLATLQPSGAPQASVVWVHTDGEVVVFSTIKGRQKTANMVRDPRVSIVVVDAADPYRYAEVRGTARLIDDPEKYLIQELSVKYTGRSFPDRPEEARVVVRVHPEWVVVRAD